MIPPTMKLEQVSPTKHQAFQEVSIGPTPILEECFLNFSASFGYTPKAYTAKGRQNNSLNYIFPTKYVIPKSLKVSHWLSQKVNYYTLKAEKKILSHIRLKSKGWDRTND